MGLGGGEGCEREVARLGRRGPADTRNGCLHSLATDGELTSEIRCFHSMTTEVGLTSEIRGHKGRADIRNTVSS